MSGERWRNGERAWLIARWRSEFDAAIETRRGGTPDGTETPEARRERQLPKVLTLIEQGEISRGLRLLHQPTDRPSRRVTPKFSMNFADFHHDLRNLPGGEVR